MWDSATNHGSVLTVVMRGILLRIAQILLLGLPVLGRGLGRSTTSAHISFGRGSASAASGGCVQTRLYTMTQDATQTNHNVISGIKFNLRVFIIE